MIPTTSGYSGLDKQGERVEVFAKSGRVRRQNHSQDEVEENEVEDNVAFTTHGLCNVLKNDIGIVIDA
jgi:hypothetical protein